MTPLRAAEMNWDTPAPIIGDTLTEASAAERFVRRHASDLRSDHRRRRWLVWDRHRWIPDSDAKVTRIGLAFARDWQRESIEILDRDKRESTFKAAIKLERRDALASMLALAKGLKPIADAGDAWDADPWLFAVPNGVIDLRTGQLRDGRREDRITMSAAEPFDPEARCPRWLQFLEEIFAGDEALIGFVHRAVGYSLTGDTGEQCLFLCDGAGANGKGSFTNTLAAVLGDYAYTMPFSTIELHQRGTIPNDLAALVGRRLITASETNDGTRINESRVKALTGCDPITARFLHEEYFTFQPIGKFWLAVNHKPIVRDDSHGFWRRIRLVPFVRTFPVNPSLAGELRAEGAGVLAWAVRGCLAWQSHGLQPPPIVMAATDQYREDSDPVRAFLEEDCEIDPASEIGASDLYAHYRAWADRHSLNERERLSATAFGRKLAERFEREKRETGLVYLGLARKVPR